jgi:Concanavalin A-like lectin/glucanases superfamily
VTDAEFSAALWVLPTAGNAPGLQVLLGKPGSWALVREADGRLLLLLARESGSFAGLRSTRPVETGRWAHVVVTQTRRRMSAHRALVVRLYLDGVLDRTLEYSDLDPLVVNDDDLLFGNSTSGDAAFLGSVAGLRFFNDDLTPEEIAALARRRPRLARRAWAWQR